MEGSMVGNPGEPDKSAAFQRHCAACGEWLSYRRHGPMGAALTESYCNNPDCEQFEQAVQSVHVS